jgi:phytoene synthase
MDKKTRQSVRYCQKVTQTQARNFYYGLKLTPASRRPALYAIYAFMRQCDDLVDGLTETPDVDVVQGVARVEEFRQRMQQLMDDPAAADQEPEQSVWPAFAYVVKNFPINADHLHGMLDGQRMDLVQRKYNTFEDLYQYCYNVAGVVGLVCVSVWGATDAAAWKLAEYRGIALQLTNILRDLAEDRRRGRVYLPMEDLQRFGVDPAMFDGGRPDAAFDRLMNFQIERARSYYEMSLKLEQYITPDCRATSLAMMRIYRALLEQIARDPRRVLTERVRVSKSRKLRIMMGAYLGR